jgi:hypothetical protein
MSNPSSSTYELIGYSQNKTFSKLCCLIGFQNETLLAGCEAYNLGTGKGTSVLEIVNAFEKASGKVYLIRYTLSIGRISGSCFFSIVSFFFWLA